MVKEEQKNMLGVSLRNVMVHKKNIVYFNEVIAENEVISSCLLARVLDSGNYIIYSFILSDEELQKSNPEENLAQISKRRKEIKKIDEMFDWLTPKEEWPAKDGKED